MTDSKWGKVEYDSLDPKQKEIYNFQKVAAVLADYGFNCVKLVDDWEGADFLALRKDSDEMLKVQLKSRLTIDKKYCGKDLWIAFPVKKCWYMVPHDELVEIVGRCTPALKNNAWVVQGNCNWHTPPRRLLEDLDEYRFDLLQG